MRAAEGLVRIEVHHVGAKISRAGDAQDGVHVGPVQVDQATQGVHPPAISMTWPSNRPSVFGLVIMNTAN